MVLRKLVPRDCTANVQISFTLCKASSKFLLWLVLESVCIWPSPS